ncbi:MAG: HEAT repeat domain-containing protein [Thiohalomonadaceae bacterium]
MSLTFEEYTDLDDLRERLVDADAKVRRVATMGLAEVMEPEAADLAIAALKDSDAGVRAEAARVLYEFEGKPEVIVALLEALSDSDTTVREAAAETLAENKDSAMGALMLERLDVEDPFVKASVLHALRELRVPGAQGPALSLLEHPDARVRREAVGVLAYLKAADVLMALMGSARRDGDPEVRRAAMGSLVFSSSDRALETLVDGLSDEHWQVREEAAFVIGKLAPASAVEPLIGAMEDEYWQVRLKAAGSLGRLKNPLAIPALGAALAYEVSNLRKEAVGAMGEIASSEALPFLEKALEDPDPDVRKLARWSMGQIHGVAQS